jgi:hypothetical protein
MRFRSQRDAFTCGPTAIYNAFRLLKVDKPTPRLFKQICEVTHCVTPGGATHYHVTRALRRARGVTLYMPRQVSYLMLTTFLTKPNAAVLLSYKTTGPGAGHMILIYAKNGTLFAVNNSLRKQVTKFTLQHLLGLKQATHFPVFWFLTKKPKRPTCSKRRYELLYTPS